MILASQSLVLLTWIVLLKPLVSFSDHLAVQEAIFFLPRAWEHCIGTITRAESDDGGSSSLFA